MKLPIDKQYWSSRYLNNELSWDIGAVSTPLQAYFDQLKNKDLLILIPGAGNAYEAEYLVNKEFSNVFVCDLAQEPLQNLKKRCPAFKDENLLLADFFDLDFVKPHDAHFPTSLKITSPLGSSDNSEGQAERSRSQPKQDHLDYSQEDCHLGRSREDCHFERSREASPNSFDLIIEQTFFCALDPSLRKKYFEKMAALLKPGGKLVGLLFDAKLNSDHPPFGGTKEEYFTYISNDFKIKTFEACYNSIKPRMGRELFINLERCN